jgi:DNA-binding PadR family transcriptional regulator
MRKNLRRSGLLPGNFEMLIPKTLTYGPLHGYGIAQFIQQVSDDVLQVEEGFALSGLTAFSDQGLGYVRVGADVE